MNVRIKFILYLHRGELVPFGVEDCECLLTVDGCHESVVRAAFDKNV